MLEVGIGNDLGRVGGHLIRRPPHVAREPGKRQRTRRQARAGGAALAFVAVALPAAVADEQLLAGLGVAGWRRPRCRRRGRRRCGLRESNGRREDECRRCQQGFHAAHRGWVTTSTSAGSPFFTTASARCSAGPRSRGLVIGPSAYTPRPCASLAKSTFGLSMVVPMCARVMPR